MQTASGGPIYSTIEKSDNTRVSYNPIIEMSKRKGLIGTLAGIQLQTEHDEAQEKRKQEEANQKRQKRRKELEDKVNAQKKHSLSSSSLINAANDLQYMDTPEGQELAKMNREDEANESAYIASLPWWKKGMFYANKLVNAGFIPVGGGTTGMAAAKTPQQTLSGFISKFGEPGNLERTVNNIILENEHWLPKETGMFAQKHSSVGSSYRKIFEELWGKENTDRLTDDQLGKLILIRNRQIDTNIPQKGDFVYVVDGQAKAYRNGQEIGYLSNSYINNGKALHPEMVKKQGTNNAGVSELLYNGTILAENRPIISGSRLLMPEVTTHIWSKYPTRKLISTEGVHAWPLRTAQERGIKLNYEKNWHTQPEFSKQHQQALDENIRTNLTGQPIYELSEPSYLPMVKNARIFDISQLRDGYINLDFTPGFAYKQGGKMNILEFLKNGSGIHIKEKNKGKFTSYCGGKVTDECIQKGKNSSNPAIRKRATFAANARKWKHKEGGIIKGQFGLGDSFWNFLYRTGIGSKGDFKRMRQDLVDFGILQDNSENPNQQIGGPTILPSITSGTVIEGLSPRAGKLANRTWLENSNPITNQETLQAAKDWVEMMKDKMRTITAKAYPTKRGRPIGSKNKPKPVQESIEQKPIKLETDYTQSGTALERTVEGKRYSIPRKGRVSSNDRNARAMESGDARTTNAGYTNVKKGQIKQVENNLDKYPEHERKALERELLKLYRKNRPESEINKVKREFYKYLAKKYGYFKIGGIIKAATGTQVNTDTTSKKFNWKPILTNVGTNLLNLGLQTFAQNNKINQETEERISDIKSPDFFDTYIEALQKAQQDEEQKLKAIEAMTGTVINYSPIVPSNTAFKAAALIYGKQKEEADAKKAAIEAQAKASKASNIQNGIFGLLQNGLGLVTDYYNNKSSNNNTSSNNSNSSSTFGNYVGTQFKNYGTFNSDGSMNLGGQLGTFSTTGGYKPQQYQMKTYTPQLKFSL